MGDSRKLPELKDDDNKIMYFFEDYGWHDITTKVKNLHKNNTLDSIDTFVEDFEKMIDTKSKELNVLESRAEEESKKKEEAKKRREENKKKEIDVVQTNLMDFFKF